MTSPSATSIPRHRLSLIHILLVRQYRHGIKETRYEICAGVCETGEEPLLSAQRELYEETGYGLSLIHI